MSEWEDAGRNGRCRAKRTTPTIVRAVYIHMIRDKGGRFVFLKNIFAFEEIGGRTVTHLETHQFETMDEAIWEEA